MSLRDDGEHKHKKCGLHFSGHGHLVLLSGENIFYLAFHLAGRLKTHFHILFSALLLPLK